MNTLNSSVVRAVLLLTHVKSRRWLVRPEEDEAAVVHLLTPLNHPAPQDLRTKHRSTIQYCGGIGL